MPISWRRSLSIWLRLRAGINKRFIIQAQNDRKISDAGFRLQILYTVNQVENIYVGLVSAYEDLQSKERALEQSKQLAADNRKQLQIGTLAPLDVVQSDSNVASDQQALVASQSALEYQQLVMKQAIARNLNDPLLASAPVIPTDRISILETPEERMPVDDLVKEANANRPDVQQVLMGLKNDEITLRALRNGLLPQVDLILLRRVGVGGKAGQIARSSMQNFRACLAPRKRRRRSTTTTPSRTYSIILVRIRESALISIFPSAIGRRSRRNCARCSNTARRNCKCSRFISR